MINYYGKFYKRLSSTKFGNVTFKFGSAKIALLMAKMAPSFLAQLRREKPASQQVFIICENIFDDVQKQKNK